MGEVWKYGRLSRGVLCRTIGFGLPWRLSCTLYILSQVKHALDVNITAVNADENRN
jgi:hypothetical protein